MICDLVQTFTGISASYQVIYQEHVIGEAIRSDNVSLRRGEKLNYDGHTYQFESTEWSNKDNRGLNKKDRKYGVDRITMDGSSVGEIYKGYWGTYLVLNGREYIMYHIAMGRKGWKYPIYCGSQQIALIEKDIVTRNKNDVYHIYALTPEMSAPAVIYALDLDCRHFRRAGDVSTASAEVEVTYTFSRSIKKKYDPEFKNRIQP